VGEVDRKELIRAYKETPRPAGVYCVRNTAIGSCLLGVTPDLPGMLNRQRFQLENGSHPDPELQADWDRYGPVSFEFEVLDRLEPQDEPAHDPAEDLAVLGALWVERLTAEGVTLYRWTHRWIRGAVR